MFITYLLTYQTLDERFFNLPHANTKQVFLSILTDEPQLMPGSTAAAEDFDAGEH